MLAEREQPGGPLDDLDAAISLAVEAVDLTGTDDPGGQIA